MADQQASDTPGVTGDTIVGGDPIVSNGANGADKYAPRLPDAVRRAAARAEELQQQIAAENEVGSRRRRRDGARGLSDWRASSPSSRRRNHHPQPISSTSRRLAKPLSHATR